MYTKRWVVVKRSTGKVGNNCVLGLKNYGQELEKYSFMTWLMYLKHKSNFLLYHISTHLHYVQRHYVASGRMLDTEY